MSAPALQNLSIPAASPFKNTGALQWVLISITLVATSIISRVGMISWPFLNDSGLYAQLGRTVANGDVLYRDFYETKLPGAALLASEFWRAFGSHWAGYVIGQLLMTFIAAGALARAASRNHGSTLPTFLFAIVFLNLAHAVYTGFQLETLQAFFEALAAMAALEALRSDGGMATFAAGLCAGMAATAKPGGLGVAAAFAVMLLVEHRRRLHHLTLLIAGVIVPLGTTAVYTVQSGAWPYLPGVLRDIAHYAAGTPVHADAMLKIAVVMVVLTWPFLVASTFGRRRSVFSRSMLFGILWFAADLIAALLQRRLYPYHFLPLACPSALLYGLTPARIKPMAITAGLLPIALLSLTWEGSSVSDLLRRSAPMPASVYIAAHTGPNDSIFSDQIGRLLIETDRSPGSRLGTFFYMVNDDAAPARYGKILRSDFESRKPVYLVLSKNWDQAIPGLASCDIFRQCPKRRENFIAAWKLLRDYVAVHYHLESAMDDMVIYRRNSFEHSPVASTCSRTSPGR